MPLGIRATVPLDTSPSRTGSADGPMGRALAARDVFGLADGASTNVFHASQAGQRPSQRIDSWPHAEQKNAVRAFAIASMLGVPSANVLGRAGRRRRLANGGWRMSGFAHVAIDGPAGSGKTTVARQLSRRLGALYLDTGAMYRALAQLALEAGRDPADEEAMLEVARTWPVRVELDPVSPLGFRVFGGERELGDGLYRNDVSRVVSLVAAHPRIRAMMVDRQREIARNGPVVMAGRDIGTVVLPDAPVKIFLTASVPERVERRLVELAARGTGVDRETLRAEIEERDRLDETRATGPLRPAAGALEIDSSGLTVEQVVGRIADIVAEHAVR
jgi:CMP/dCMP kinase